MFPAFQAMRETSVLLKCKGVLHCLFEDQDALGTDRKAWRGRPLPRAYGEEGKVHITLVKQYSTMPGREKKKGCTSCTTLLKIIEQAAIFSALYPPSGYPWYQWPKWYKSHYQDQINHMYFY